MQNIDHEYSKTIGGEHKEASVSSIKKASEFLENTCGCGGMADAPALGAGG